MIPFLQTSRAIRLGAALLSGLLLFFVMGFKPVWPLLWVAPIPLLLAAFSASALETWLLAFLAGTLGLSSSFGFIAEVAGPILAVILILLQAAGWGIVVSFTRRTVLHAKPALAVFAYPVAWAAMDTLAAWNSPHGTAGSLAYSQMEALPVIQIASLAGTAGVVFLACLLPSLIAVALLWRKELPQRWPALALQALVLIAGLGYGALRLSTGEEPRAIPVGLVAIDNYIGAKTPPERRNAIWDAYQRAVVKFAQAGAHVIVLPEKIAPLDPTEAEALRMRWSNLAQKYRVTIAIGLTRVEVSGRKANKLWLFAPDGTQVGDYDKQHPVPGLEAEVNPGNRNAVAQVEGNPFGLAICKDMDFPELTRQYGQAGIVALLVPAWDFSTDGWLHGRMAILRGVESGFTVLRAARQGRLTISDRYGRVLAEAASSELPGGTLTGMAPLPQHTNTLYNVVGNLFGWTCVILCGLSYLLKLCEIPWLSKPYRNYAHTRRYSR